jgi:outer membrane protein OmpA-like peptidoglycan-associated protein
MKRTLIIYFLFFAGILNAQNLVKNPSFEEFKKLPKKPSQIDRINFWSTANKGNSADFMHTKGYNILKSKTPTELKLRYSAFERNGEYYIARTGDACVGIYAQGFMETQTNIKWSVREYILSSLIEPLKKDKSYCVSFYILYRPGDNKSKLGATSIGMYLGMNIPVDKKNGYLNYEAQIITNKPEILTSKNRWKRVCSLYTAIGGENTLVIGNFENSQNKLDIGYNAYYFIDDVSVIGINHENTCDCIENINDSIETKQFVSELNKPIRLENISFEFAKSVLQDSSFVELDRLVSELKKHKSYQITLSGYTDNIGKEEDNLKLSVERAKAVAEYLISQGVEKKRVIYKGYGSLKPIADNESEEGKKTNRRVEFIIKER